MLPIKKYLVRTSNTRQNTNSCVEFLLFISCQLRGSINARYNMRNVRFSAYLFLTLSWSHAWTSGRVSAEENSFLRSLHALLSSMHMQILLYHSNVRQSRGVQEKFPVDLMSAMTKHYPFLIIVNRIQLTRLNLYHLIVCKISCKVISINRNDTCFIFIYT